MIYFQVPKPDAPSGGVWFLYKCVDLLNRAGKPARALQRENEYIAWWDACPIDKSLIVTEARLHDSDVLVVPEGNWPPVQTSGRHIMFVQNYIWLPKGIDLAREKPETIVCSQFLKNHMRRVYGIEAPIITPYLEEKVWAPTPKQKNRTLVMARRTEYAPMVRDALELEGFPVEYVDASLTQRQLAEKLADCEFYMHLVSPEGWPMACVEAQRMGTIVCGTTGGGGLEFMFNRETAMVVQSPEEGRYSPQQFIDNLMSAMWELRGRPGGEEAAADLRSRMWQAAYNWSLQYNAEATTKQLLKVFG